MKPNIFKKVLSGAPIVLGVVAAVAVVALPDSATAQNPNNAQPASPVTVVNTPLEVSATAPLPVQPVGEPILLVAQPSLDNGCPAGFSQQIELYRIRSNGQPDVAPFALGPNEELSITDVYWEVARQGSGIAGAPGSEVTFLTQPVIADLSSVYGPASSISLVRASSDIDPSRQAINELYNGFTSLASLETVAVSQHLQVGVRVGPGVNLCARAVQRVRVKNGRGEGTHTVEALVINGMLLSGGVAPN